MSNICYLDNSATTPPCKETVEAINESLTLNWGNPSSLYLLGINAESELNRCKEAISKNLGCRSDEIYFTSGGTEANNIAIRGAVYARAKRGNRIVTSIFEHPSVLQTIQQLESEGFEVIYLKPDSEGHIPNSEIATAITQNTIFVSLMLVNNEIGTIQSIAYAAECIRKVSSPALLHTDAVQGFGKLPIKPSALGVDLLSASGHKIHGPKGIGFLYIKKGTHITPTVFGGGQQDGIRPGTEPTPAIAGLYGAVAALPDTKAELSKIGELWRYARGKLSALECVRINSPDDCLPYILNISAIGFRSETLLHFLEERSIYVSSGSACSKGALSNTLSSLGLDKSIVDSAIRISFSRYSEKQDVDRLYDALSEATQKLRRTK